MATQTTVMLVDDLDGSEADEQVKFMVDGRSYEIDLSSRNSKKLREARSHPSSRRHAAPAVAHAAEPAAPWRERPRIGSRTRRSANGRSSKA
jgi:ribosome assembly protein YihI (activator of Der GTPase)